MEQNIMEQNIIQQIIINNNELKLMNNTIIIYINEEIENNRILEYEKGLSFKLNDPYYFIKRDVLSKEKCQQIINMFEDSEKHDGETIIGIDYSTKKTHEVNIRGPKWKEIDSIITKILTTSIIEYAEYLNTIVNNNYILKELNKNITDTGYQIQKYIKDDGYYIWHNDFTIGSKKSCRIVTFIFYLNHVEEGGETYFYNGKIKPETGKLLLFPATWTYNHKGNMPISNDKYIITGWFYN